MEDKLQKLTQKLYEEGLSKGRSDADDLVNKAKAEAAAIIDEAKVKAGSIIHQAEQSAAEMKKNTETEVALASRQVISELKSRIQNLIAAKELTPAIQTTVKESAFLKEMILAIAKNWDGCEQTHTDLDVMLPKETSAALIDELKASLKKALDSGIEVKTDDSVKSGFKVAPQAGGYYISFTDADFDELFREYLRPKVAELLFGDK